MKVGVDTLARELRSRVREEFLGPVSDSARERVKYMSAATARHTTRDPMVVGKPLSSITGSILTNVRLPAGTVAAVDPKLQSNHGESGSIGAASKPIRFEEIKGVGGGGGGDDAYFAGTFW